MLTLTRRWAVILALVALPALVVAGTAAPAAATTEVQLWYALTGELGERLVEIVEGFNKSQSEYRVAAVYKGNYTETMTAAIAAFRARKQPHMVQVFEVGTATMMAAKGAIKPVYEVMAEAGERFDPRAFIPAVTGYYTTPDGRMLSMPFNSSTPVLFYNKDLFRKAGLDPERPPRTWPEVESYSRKLQAAGVPCGFTTGWQTWVQLENFSAWHNVPFATRDNGFGGLDTELVFNSPLHVRHIQQMAEWQKTKIFDYGGRRGEPNPKYYNGECAMLMNSSAFYEAVRRASEGKFEFGIGMLPYYPDVAGAPQNSIIGGATVWVFSGHKPAEYKGIARFFTYLSSVEVQAAWHQRTGYLPITQAAYDVTKQQGFYAKHPGTDVSVLQLNHKPPTPNSRGLRLGNFVQIRDVMDEELEAVWAGKKSAKEALDTAVRRGNDLLRQFERAHR
jgi:sn-glycerol 3-phosphate transport system substrate-binding protein